MKWYLFFNGWVSGPIGNWINPAEKAGGVWPIPALKSPAVAIDNWLWSQWRQSGSLTPSSPICFHSVVGLSFLNEKADARIFFKEYERWNVRQDSSTKRILVSLFLLCLCIMSDRFVCVRNTGSVYFREYENKDTFVFMRETPHFCLEREFGFFVTSTTK